MISPATITDPSNVPDVTSLSDEARFQRIQAIADVDTNEHDDELVKLLFGPDATISD